MKRFALTILTLVAAVPAGADEFLPQSKLLSTCERLLVDGGWIKRPTRARIHSTDASVFWMGETIAVKIGSGNPTRFARTRRDVVDMIHVDNDFPRSFFTLENFAGKKVLDLACGEGRAVEQLRRQNVDVIGLDIFLTPYMRSKPYYVQASAHKTGFADGSFDIIYSDQGPFTYLESNREMMSALMIEAHRILKKGGVLRLSSVRGYGNFREHGARPEIDLKDTIYTNLPPGMRIKRAPDRWWFLETDPGEESGHGARYWLELERID